MGQIGGIILCGGESTRMGRPKAWLPFGSESMLARVTRILREASLAPLVVVAAPGQALPELPAEVEVARDDERGRGPLQGMAAGFAALRGRADAAFVSSCDVPFLRPAFIRRMIELLGDHSICVPRVGGFDHPLAAVYRTEVLSGVEQLIAAGRMRPVFLFEKVPTRLVEAAELRDVDPDLVSLRNINTPDEYAQGLREEGRLRRPANHEE